jgi:hypothetical protein
MWKTPKNQKQNENSVIKSYVFLYDIYDYEGFKKIDLSSASNGRLLKELHWDPKPLKQIVIIPYPDQLGT